MSNLVKHAERELRLLGQTTEDPEYAASIIKAVEAFASYGHSGGSAMTAIAQLHQLLQFRTLTPLTSNSDEWMDRSAESGHPLWQSIRDPAAFSTDGGQTWYYVDDRQGEKGGGPVAIAEDQVPYVASMTADEWNRCYPIGTPVRAYPGTREGRHVDGVTRSEAFNLGHGAPVVLVTGLSGGIALTHVDIRDANEGGHT